MEDPCSENKLGRKKIGPQILQTPKLVCYFFKISVESST